MVKAAATKKINGIGDAAVQAKTGKTWPEWFAVLDRAGAAKMSHKDIAIYLHEKQGVPEWWCQMVAVGYEQERGLRQVHQKPDGFSAGVSRTIGVPIAALYGAWTDEKQRKRWLPETGLTIRKATPNRSLRITWTDGKTSVSVMFYPKGEEKSQVTVTHEKLAAPKDVARMKTYWGEALDRLKAALDGTDS